MNRTLWYTQPAGQWEEALPLGNGRMGAMISGEVCAEKIQVNEESMWYGGYVERQNPDAHRYLSEIRQLLAGGQIQKAQQLMGLALTGCPNSMHPYQTLGDIYLYMDGPEKAGDYKRTLDLNQALATVEYTGNGTTYRREILISHPADCMIMKLEAKGRRKINFTARMDRQKQFDGVGKVGKDCIQLWGNLGRGGGEFSMLLAAKTVGGSVRTVGESLIVENADVAYLYFRGDTTYQYSGEEKAEYVAYITERPLENLPDLWNEWNYYEQQEYRYQQALRMFLLNKQLQHVRKAMQSDYEQLKREHIQDYRNLFDRVELRLNAADRSDLPTNVRVEQAAQTEDVQLVNLLFDYGRYLLIACSRSEGLPATLQGLWNKDFQPPWDSKYTININTEMNYWPAEPCNLSECHMPLFRLLKKLQKRGRRTAREMYGCRGFVAHHNTDMHGDTAPQDLWIPATYWPMGGAWLSTHIWTHYQYTPDKRFLAEYFPVLAEASLFFVDYLVEDGT
ncbi:MAG: glycoside hydrolase family 95 protein, partial [Lachnospiraceae bacterium]|nr:glycoside hydrolase family 95 protein [Lachnospiraceae bacterium]